jgi:uncharacterized protein YdaU (DUF1376 family)
MSPGTNAVDVSISMSVHLGDMLRETAHLSVTEMGAHMRLAMAAWARGGFLDGNPERLRRLAGVDSVDWPTIWEALGELWFKGEDGRIFHPRTLAELERARDKKASYQARGKLGGRPAKAEPKLTESSALAGGEAAGKTPPPPPPPPPDPSPPPELDGTRPRDPCSTEHGVGSTVRPPGANGKPSAYNVVAMFLRIRATIPGMPAPFSQPQSNEIEKAERWLSGMTAEDAKEIEPVLTLACKHVAEGDNGWTHESNKKAVFLFSSIIANWRDLREELRGCVPGASPPKNDTRHTGISQKALERMAQLKTSGGRP